MQSRRVCWLRARGSKAQSCDRACLVGLTDQYLRALVAHDPKAAPLADTVRFVENIRKLKPSEGLWTTATAGPTRFSIHVPDPVTGKAGWMGMLEQGQGGLVAIRLKVESGRITEAEHLIAAISSEDGLSNLQEPRAGLVTEVPPKRTQAARTLVKIGAGYYDALDDNNGSLMPFAADCESGARTAWSRPAPNLVPRATRRTRTSAASARPSWTAMAWRPSRPSAIAVARGRPGDGPCNGLLALPSRDGQPALRSDAQGRHEGQARQGQHPPGPFDLPAAHIFKIGADGKVHEIEAKGFLADFNAPSGWDD